MKTTITVLGKIFELKSKLSRSGVNFPYSDSKTIHNEFTVSVKNKDGVTRQFKFYDSQANFERGKMDLTEEDLKYCFRCFIEDGLSGSETFEDFCSGFGLSTDSIRALKIYKSCQKTLKKLFDLGITENELTDIINELSEKGIE